MTHRPSFFAPIADATLRAILVDARERRDHVAVRLIQNELHYRQPIKVECDYEWQATRGDYDLGDLVGRGRTEREAVEHLLEQEEDDRCPLCGAEHTE